MRTAGFPCSCECRHQLRPDNVLGLGHDGLDDLPAGQDLGDESLGLSRPPQTVVHVPLGEHPLATACAGCKIGDVLELCARLVLDLSNAVGYRVLGYAGGIAELAEHETG